jgi:hypothetical protein
MKKGWYSVEQSKLGGVIRYKNAAGEIVEVTSVTDTMEHGMHFEDMAYVGEVVQFVERVSYGRLGGLMKPTPENVSRLRNIVSEELGKKKLPKDWN